MNLGSPPRDEDRPNTDVRGVLGRFTQQARIRRQWEEFVTTDLPALVAPIQAAATPIAASVVGHGTADETPSGLPDETDRDLSAISARA
jgi:hypothetical protein